MGGEEKMGHRKRPSDLDRKFVGGDRPDDRAKHLTQQEILPRCQVYVGVFCLLLCIICGRQNETSWERISLGSGVRPSSLPSFRCLETLTAQPPSQAGD